MVYWLSVRTHSTRVVRSNPARVTIKTPLVGKATGNHLINSISLVKDSESLVSATLEIEYATQFVVITRVGERIVREILS